METCPPPADGAPDPLAAIPAKEERTLAMLCHLLALAGFLFNIPGGSIIGPLVLWAFKKDGRPFVNDQGKEAVNFNITVNLVLLACMLTFWLVLPLLLLVGVAVAAIILVLIAAIQASEGRAFRYPCILRLVR